MRTFRAFNVAPCIPRELAFLETLANNLWWCWNPDAGALFRRISPRVFKAVHSNPLRLLSEVDQHRLELMAGDAGFLSHLEQVRARFEEEVLTSKHWQHPGKPFSCVAYFSLEFGLNENIRLYSGGLGVLAGDHLKSASDLDEPVVAVGLLYREGYFEQHIDMSGFQLEEYPENDVHSMPVTRLCDDSGQPILVHVALPEGPLWACLWRLDVGRVPLILLDTNLPENAPELRLVTGQLYGGDRRTRLRQELLLGVGGYRALRALGYDVRVCHMNEGHAAFLALARMQALMKEQSLDLDTAREIVRRTSVFTTHTPVPAGNETFELELLMPHLTALEDDGGISAQQVVEWGRAPGDDASQELSMTVLGFNCSQYNNGVSALHGIVERDMWAHLWPERPVDENPIDHITNGVHVSTWLSPENAELYTRYLGPDWQSRAMSKRLLHRVEQIPDEELWRAHEVGRSHLIRCAREHYEKRLQAHSASRDEIAQARSILDQDALTIGFARRFATYKRATLLLRDKERLAALLTDPDRPVQLIFAGKAHPADQYGKELIQQIVQFANKDGNFRRVVFLENYDMCLARHLVRGVDVWLNTPRRPHEASGTSGMKACINGGIHMSVLDGWWCEGYSSECGWAIGSGEDFRDEDYQDHIESQAIYNLLENEVVPAFYDRLSADVPLRWTAMMKASIRMSLSKFTSRRMVSDYAGRAYTPALANYAALTAEHSRQARDSVSRHTRLKQLWPKVRISRPRPDRDIGGLHVGDRFQVESVVFLGELTPDEVAVEVYYGPMDPFGKVTTSHALTMDTDGAGENGAYHYRQSVACDVTGRFGFTARVTPRGDEWCGMMPGYICWASGDDS